MIFPEMRRLFVILSAAKDPERPCGVPGVVEVDSSLRSE